MECTPLPSRSVKLIKVVSFGRAQASSGGQVLADEVDLLDG